MHEIWLPYVSRAAIINHVEMNFSCATFFLNPQH